jgi:hypothetical protein
MFLLHASVRHPCGSLCQDRSETIAGLSRQPCCSGLTELPEDLQVGGEIEVAGTGLRGLPESLRHVRLTWDEVEVDERIAFTPEALTAREILDEPDKDRRRMMIG